MTAPEFSTPPRRVVSLVPSLTESMFGLGLGDRLVAVTDYCIHPRDRVAPLPKVGGTKNPDIAAILQIQPDLILANQEENTPAAVQALRAEGIPVWLTFPHTVDESIDLLLHMSVVFRSEAAGEKVRWLARGVEWQRASASDARRRAYFCPVWQDGGGEVPGWWMTFNGGTYCSDVLQLFGLENVFASRQRRHPLLADLGKAPAEPSGERDTRYPRVSLEEILAAEPEMILLPSEPFAYAEEHLRALARVFAGTPAARNGNLILIDGTLITWFGTRLSHALDVLPGLLDTITH